MSSPVQIASLLPENAPFTPEQRTWLNGLFAGLLGLDGTATALSPEQTALLLPGVAPPAAPADGKRGCGAPGAGSRQGARRADAACRRASAVAAADGRHGAAGLRPV